MKKFEKVDPKPDFPKIDEEVLSFWKDEKVFEHTQKRDSSARRSAKSLGMTEGKDSGLSQNDSTSLKLREAGKGGEKNFIFFEGPPTANGRPGVHHVLSRVFKDIILRYKTMQGYHIDRKGGWDTHGLPVELEVEKNLGISGKPDIEKYGVEKFNKKCRESVFKYVKEWEELTKKIGFWVDTKDPYVTYDSSYIQSLWWVLGEAWKKDLLYEGYKVVPYCPRCGTALSSHEVSQGYKDITENTVYVKFPVEGEKDTYFLAWTTTPWTLPGNSGLAFGPNIKYVKAESEGEKYILAKDRLEKVFEGKKYKILGEFYGKEIVESIFNGPTEGTKHYKPLFADGAKFKKEKDTEEYTVIMGDFVSTEDGTGIVHIAPAFGEDDYEVGRIQNGLSVLMTVDEQGNMLTEVGKGKFAKDADSLIVSDLKKRGLIFKEEEYTHSYPYCWRCGTPLLYYARDTWYIRMSSLRKELVKNNEEVHWYPSHMKNGRFGEWIREAKDWALSRERYWGTPLPIWKCDKCGKKELISSYEELGDKTGKKIPDDFDPHRPYIDDYTWKCDCGSEFKRYTHVIDCWFDSGAMPYAQWGYPSAAGSEEGFKTHFPADYICEAVDQTRGWFYTLLAISTFLGKGPAYKHVISLGHILDEKGEKMSKSKGNVVNPWDVLSAHGADALRWYMYSATMPGNPRNFSVKLVGEAKRFLVTYWNVYSFFVTYANVDNYVPSRKHANSENILDKWILSRKNKLVESVTKHLERYNIYKATQEIEQFIDDLSNWYVRRSRRRFWKSENDTDKTAAYDTLYEVLVGYTKVLAPFMPFVTETVYQNLAGGGSVHLSEWPKFEKGTIDEKIETAMQSARSIVEAGLADRNENGIKVRQPLMSLSYGGTKLDAALEQIIAEEVNVKEVTFNAKLKTTIALNTEITEELKVEGLAREIVRKVQAMRKKAGFNVEDRIHLYWSTADKAIQSVFEKENGYIAKETLAEKVTVGDIEKAEYSEKARIEGAEIELGVQKIK